MAKKSQRIRRRQRIERLKTAEEEARFIKIAQDNSVMINRMKNMSSSILGRYVKFLIHY